MRVLEIVGASPSQAKTVQFQKALPRTTRQTIAVEAHEPALDVVMRAKDGPWNSLGHILRLEEHQIIQEVLMNCVRPTPDSLFGDTPDRDNRKASEITTDREKWKKSRAFQSKCSKCIHVYSCAWCNTGTAVAIAYV